MLFIFYFISILTAPVHSPIRTDCYASFSIPVIYIKVSHYYPTGPLYLYVLFDYVRYSILPGTLPEMEIFNYHFKKIDVNCKSSFILTTMGKDFKVLDLAISLRLNRYSKEIVSINYNFYRGFKPGVYEMFDKAQNFALHVLVLEGEEYLKVNVQSLDEDADIYLNSIAEKNNQLCVITVKIFHIYWKIIML